MKKCILEEKECTDCGLCDDRCQLDPNKICDNCFRCLDTETLPYAEIPIAGVYTADDYLPEQRDLHPEQARFLHIQTLHGLRGKLRRK